MRTTASALAAVALAVLSGCGPATEHERAAPRAPAGVRELIEPAPPIQAVDEAPGELALGPLGLGGEEAVGAGCIVSFGTTGSDERDGEGRRCDELSPAERAQFEEHDRRFRQAVEPAPGFPPRTIAKLELEGDRLLSLTAWRTTSGRLCFATETRDGDGGGGSGPGGPCLTGEEVNPACGEQLCLESSGNGPPLRWTLEGVVASTGDALRITLRSGTVRRYPLTGPLVPGFPEYRVFLLDLERDRFRKLELLVRGVPVAEHELPPEFVRMEECAEAAMPAPDSADFEGRSASLEECLRSGE